MASEDAKDEDIGWLKVVVETDETDRVSDALVQAFGLGGAEVRDSHTPSKVVIYVERSTVSTPDELRASVRQRLDDDVPDADHSVRSVEPYGDTDWETAWQAFFEPLQLSPRVMVGPPWHAVPLPEPTDGSVPTARLIVEPGMAFGTGTHETTQMSATLLDEWLQGADDAPSVLDVGCGSGILSLAAVSLEAGHATGIDIEADAIEAADHNAEVNGLADRCEFSTTPLADIDRRYPVVVANMLSHLLREIRAPLLASVEPGGQLIVSGITSDEFDHFLQDFTHRDWEVVSRRTDGNWAAASLRAPDDVDT